MHLSERLLKEGKGISVHGQLAGSVPRPPAPRLSLHVHTQTHTLQLTGTGLGLNIYQAHANKSLFWNIMINPRLRCEGLFH